MEQKPLSKYIDHTLLKATASREEIIAVCEEAKKYNTASVCVNSCYAATVAEELRGTGIMTCCVVGFPLGAMSTAAKAEETRLAVADGAEEIDMVINVGFIKGKEWELAEKDIEAVVKASGKAHVKVIIETCLLTDEEKVKACEISQKAGADFVKTSTGFSTGGATVEDVALMRKTVGAAMGVKASGGIHSREEALAMIEAGATRIGASATAAILA